MFLIFNILILVISVPLNSAQEEWTYEEQNSWNRQFQTCGGGRQSPININTNKVIRMSTLFLNLKGYDRAMKNLKIHNDGHTARIAMEPKGQRAQVSGSAVNGDKYDLEQLHFHWGDNNLEGTEHSINNNFGSAELHLVHFNKKYETLSNASQRSDGIVVLTVFLQLSRNRNNALHPIISQLRSIEKYNTSATLGSALILEKLLPTTRDLFFRYKGSLTTPPCSESVTFIIFADPIRIGSDQLSQFRRLYERPLNRRSLRIVRNTRERQPKNGRTVEISSPDYQYNDYEDNDLY